MNQGSTAPWVLALDVGTSSARAIVFDSAGQAVQGLRHQEAYTPDSNEPGQATFDPDFLVGRAAVCIDAVLGQAGAEARRIAAVGVTTFWHSCLGIGKAGEPVTPLITWADTRSADDAEMLKKQLDPAAYHSRTGCVIHPSYFPARIEWLRRTQPFTFRAVDKWLSPGEYLFLRLFGEAGCSISMASGTGLFNQNTCDWDQDALSTLALPADRLAPLTDIDRPVSGLLMPWGERWPALTDIPWVPAIGDGAASNLGSGSTTDRHIAINLGTSGAIRVLYPAERVTIPDDLWCYRLDRKRFVMGGAFSDGGDVAVWMRNTLQFEERKTTPSDVEKMAPDSHGLTFLPFLAGERSPGWQPQRRATLHGLTTSTTPAKILRAGMEAVALRFALVHRSLRASFPRATEIVAGGGGFKQAPFWAQITADALGVPLNLSDEAEATSRGAAAVALRAVGVLSDESDLPAPPTHTLEPNMTNHDVYQIALARQQALYEALARL